jgi:hypothetical protein
VFANNKTEENASGMAQKSRFRGQWSFAQSPYIKALALEPGTY